MSASATFPWDFTVRLLDGRSIGIASLGRDDGFPIIHCHASGSSRLEVKLFAAQASEEGVRLIGLDRPGIGRSDPKPGYRLLDWPDDVVEVADRLGIERFAVEGISAGGPYALACAYKIPHRLTACGLISTVSLPDLIRLLRHVCFRRSCRIVRPPSILTRGISRPWLTMLRPSSTSFVGSPRLRKRSLKMT